MELKKGKLVRFYSDGKQYRETSWGKNDLVHPEVSSADNVPSSLLKADNGMVGGRNRLTETNKVGKSKIFPVDHPSWHQRMLDPGSDIVLRWNRIFLVSCLLALFVDPLYFYLPTVGGDEESSCVNSDSNLRIVVTFFRTVADLFYLLHMIIKFRTAYVAPNTRVFGRGELVMDPKKIARRYIRSDFFIDLIATLPLPQRQRQIEAINGAWAMIGLTAGLVIEGGTGKSIPDQLAGYWFAIVHFFFG